ncbi:MAG: iron uptake porin, partial [Cyanobacteria bacterium J06626_14]
MTSIAPALGNEASDVLSVYALEGSGSTDNMGQVTSVSQLSDVEPTDWAFQALQSLVERYGCIAGYPDGTYRGNRAMTRFEFAAGLNACLDRINELIAAGLADKVSREDLAVLQRLQEEFAAELATLRGRVDALEARTAELEANQFSTTTKLRGEVIFFTP